METKIFSHDALSLLSTIEPNNIIPSLEQSIELEKLNQSINYSKETKQKIRDLNILLRLFKLLNV